MTNSTENNQQSNATSEYFDLHTSGVGYLNRIREVEIKKGGNFMACTIGALRGSKSDVEYTYFDCRVSGSEASKVVKTLIDASKANKQILAGFKIGDLYPETFIYKSESKKGQTGINLKAHLLYLSWVKIDGDTFYTAPSKKVSSENNDDAPVPEEKKSTAGSAVGEFNN